LDLGVALGFPFPIPPPLVVTLVFLYLFVFSNHRSHELPRGPASPPPVCSWEGDLRSRDGFPPSSSPPPPISVARSLANQVRAPDKNLGPGCWIIAPPPLNPK